MPGYSSVPITIQTVPSLVMLKTFLQTWNTSATTVGTGVQVLIGVFIAVPERPMVAVFVGVWVVVPVMVLVAVLTRVLVAVSEGVLVEVVVGVLVEVKVLTGV